MRDADNLKISMIIYKYTLTGYSITQAKRCSSVVSCLAERTENHLLVLGGQRLGLGIIRREQKYLLASQNAPTL